MSVGRVETVATRAGCTTPLPDEPDVTVSIYLTDSSPYPLTFVACESAARRFADHWQLAALRPVRASRVHDTGRELRATAL